MNVVCLTDTVHLSNTKVLRGERLDPETGEWKEVQDEVVAPNITLRAGSVIEKSEAQVKVGLKQGWYAPVGTPLHTNLESVFQDLSAPFMGKGNEASLANILRSYRIQSLEQVAENAVGKEPFTDGQVKGGMPLRVQDILLRHLNQNVEQVEALMNAARAAVKEN